MVTPCQVQLGQVQCYLDDAQSFFNNKENKRQSASFLRQLRYLRHLYICAYEQRDYRSIIDLIRELSDFRLSLQPYVAARDADAFMLHDEAGVLIENLNDLEASQNEEVIARYQKLVLEYNAFFEKLLEGLGSSETSSVMPYVNHASDKIDCFRHCLTPCTASEVVNVLLSLPDVVLTGHQKRKCKKEAQSLVAELLNLSVA